MGVLPPALCRPSRRPDLRVIDHGRDAETVGVGHEPVRDDPAGPLAFRVLVRPEHDVQGSSVVMCRAVDVAGIEASGLVTADLQPGERRTDLVTNVPGACGESVGIWRL